MKHRNIFIILAFFFVTGVAAIVTNLTLAKQSHWFIDSTNGYRLKLPKNAINVVDGSAIVNDVTSNALVYQIGLKPYVGLGSEVGPFLQVVTIDPKTFTADGSDLSVAAYIQSDVENTYTNPQQSTSGLWDRICSSETAAYRCTAILKITNKNLLVASYDVQKTPAAASTFATAFQEMIDSVIIK